MLYTVYTDDDEPLAEKETHIMNNRNTTMHPAKALQTAVFTLADVTYANTVNIRNTDIVVSMKFGRYIINDAGTEWRHLDRTAAIEKLKSLLTV